MISARTVTRMGERTFDTDPAVSAAARSLVQSRWGSQRTDRLANELAARGDLAERHAALVAAALRLQRGDLDDTPQPDEGELP